MSPDDGIEFARASFPDGIVVRDHIDGAESYLLTADPFAIESVDETDSFLQPLDATARVTGLDAVRTPFFLDAYVRDEAGDLIATVNDSDEIAVKAPAYVEFGGYDSKLYLRVDSGDLLVRNRRDHVEIEVLAPAVTLGARSFHERPETTIATTGDPADVAAALSHLGSALKTTTCERSWPTLRGHPPELERGPSLDVPDSLDRPDTDAELVVPADLSTLFEVAPLAYYLGASVSLGDGPALDLGSETIPLDGDADRGERPHRLLKRAFVLDCLVRTEGLYDVDLYRRSQLESAVDLDAAALYGRPLAEQLSAYLDVPWTALEPIVPRWKTTVDLRPTPDNVAALPYVANQLAEVRTLAYDAADRSDGGVDAGSLFVPTPTDSVEHVHVGPGIAASAASTEVPHLRRTYRRSPDAPERITVAVVNNDAEMRGENVVSDIYGTREWYEFGVEQFEDCTTGELADVLRSDFDFVHLIGHNDAGGFECRDGLLDVRTLDSVNVDSYLLNACESFEQAHALVEAGAVGGLATQRAVNSRPATEVGLAVARLLNLGYSLLQTLHIVQRGYVAGSDYVVIGNGNRALVHREGLSPLLVVVERGRDGGYDVTVEHFAHSTIGGLSAVTVDDSYRYLNWGSTRDLRTTASELESYLEEVKAPVLVGGTLRWSEELTVDEIDERLLAPPV